MINLVKLNFHWEKLSDSVLRMERIDRCHEWWTSFAVGVEIKG